LFSSSVLDVAMGVVFAFLAVSLISSAIVESLNSFFKLRARSLLGGIKDLVNDPKLLGLAKALYEHAAVNPRGTPAAAPTGGLALVWRGMMGPKRGPAYVDPEQFASALLDVLGFSAAVAPGAGPGALGAAVAGIADPQVKQLLAGMVNRSQGNIELMKKEIAAWFDSAMDRVGGAFKRWTQLASFVIALVLAVLLNVDTIHLATQLWEQPVIAANLKLPSDVNTKATDKVAEATEMASVLQADLPVGWPAGHFIMLPDSSEATATSTSKTVPAAGAKTAPPSNPKTTPTADAQKSKWHLFFWSDPFGPGFPWERFAGWFVTAFATLFGAPFWFDTLQSFVRLKGAGPSPSEKQKDSAASA
jgi:hypothetical protein